MRNLMFLAFAIVGTACAQTGSHPNVAAEDSVTCLRETGSRIKPPPGECNDNPGRVVTREEMERSGSFTTFDALRKSVPQAR